MTQIDDTVTMARLLGNLYAEIFQRRRSEVNSVLSKSSHPIDSQNLKEDKWNVLHAGTTIWVWGPSGKSDQTDSSPLQGRWSECFWG